MAGLANTDLVLPSEYETAKNNNFRFQNLAWLLISLFQAASLVYFSGAEYKLVIFYAIGAPAAYFLTCWIKIQPWDQLRLFPVILYICVLPLAVEKYVTSDWVSIGLILTCASLSASMIRSKTISSLFILSCATAQYLLAKSDIQGVSDTNDTLLLNGYFSTVWILLGGFASLLIIQRYYSFCQELDGKLEDLSLEYWERSKTISRLNLRDHINLRLHGTLLNTLIVAENMTGNISPKSISNQLKKELDDLQNESFSEYSKNNIKDLIESKIDFGRLKYEINTRAEVEYLNQKSELVIELLREIVLNINKHTHSNYIYINIFLDGDNRLSLTVQEKLTGIFKKQRLLSDATSARESKSMKRLCDQIGATYFVDAYPDNFLLHRITLNLIDEDLNILSEASSIRSNSLKTFVSSVSAISAIFSFLAFPGFIALNVPFALVLIILVCASLHLYLLSKEKLNQFLVSLLVILPLTMVPYAINSSDFCTTMSPLPWLVNCLLGSFLFASFSSTSFILRWLPGFVMFLECFSINFLVPAECSSILNGTTPGIAIALFLARLTLSRRERNKILDAELESILISQSDSNKEVQIAVSDARSKVLFEIEKYADSLASEISIMRSTKNLISLIKSFLLCSEKFETLFYREIFYWIFSRYEVGAITSLSIFQLEESEELANLDLEELLAEIQSIFNIKDLTISITISNQILVELESSAPVSEHELNTLNRINSKVFFSQVSTGI